MEKIAYSDVFNHQIQNFFKGAFSACLRDPGLAVFIYKAIMSQKQAQKRRAMWETNGVHVPPIIIVSVTNRCNLACKGCYHKAHKRASNPELSRERWGQVLDEASSLGVSVVMFAGGEPFVRGDILLLAKDHPEIIFPVFTNGLLLKGDAAKPLRGIRNLIPVISIEGFEAQTDERRGKGVFEAITATMKELKKNHSLFGASVTVTRTNFDTVTSDVFIKGLAKSGCRLVFFVEYVPIEEGTEHLIPTVEQRTQLDLRAGQLSKELGVSSIAFPGNEELYGGCLAAGRGFVHIAPDGSLEPCPFAPYSDINLNNKTLKEALSSEFLKKIRDGHGMLTETSGGCALWTNREWVRSLLAKPTEEKAPEIVSSKK